jgi:membrane associated rhomboid family serine protease
VFPLHDDNPSRTTPVVTISLIAANVAMFFYQMSIGLNESSFRMGLIPALLLQHQVEYGVLERIGIDPRILAFNLEPSWATIFTSMFMHGGWLHILSNMWFLWIFGNNVEDELGKLRFLGFYLVCGVGAALAQAYLSPGSPIPMVGASGAVAGVLGAYMVLFPSSRVLCLVTLLFFITTIELPAALVLGFWFLLQLIDSLKMLGPRAPIGGVAFAAHVGGFALGWLLVRLLATGRRPPPRSMRRDYVDWR